jgi:hypothetical protein
MKKLICIFIIFSTLSIIYCDYYKNVLIGKPEYALNIAINPKPAGIVTITPKKELYYYGEKVKLEVNTNNLFKFLHWEGDQEINQSQIETIEIQMDSNKYIRAVFTEDAEGYIFNIEQIPPNSGNISINDYASQYDDGSYFQNANIDIESNPNQGKCFLYWKENGNIYFKYPTTAVCMNKHIYLEAHFSEAQNKYNIQINVMPPGAGTVSLLPEGPYYHNQKVEFVVNPENGYVFSSLMLNKDTIFYDSQSNTSYAYITNNNTLTTDFSQYFVQVSLHFDTGFEHIQIEIDSPDDVYDMPLTDYYPYNLLLNQYLPPNSLIYIKPLPDYMFEMDYFTGSNADDFVVNAYLDYTLIVPNANVELNINAKPISGYEELVIECYNYYNYSSNSYIKLYNSQPELKTFTNINTPTGIAYTTGTGAEVMIYPEPGADFTPYLYNESTGYYQVSFIIENDYYKVFISDINQYLKFKTEFNQDATPPVVYDPGVSYNSNMITIPFNEMLDEYSIPIVTDFTNFQGANVDNSDITSISIYHNVLTIIFSVDPISFDTGGGFNYNGSLIKDIAGNPASPFGVNF